MRKRIFAFVMVLLLLCCQPVAASAEPLVDMNARGSITVNLVYQKKPLEGMKLTCIQVGKLVEEDNEYFYESLFSRDIFTTKSIHNPKNPEKMLKLVENSNRRGITKKANKHGVVKFEDLKPGLYLIYQREPYTKDGKTYTIQPFFVTIPLDGKYDVEAKCKLGIDASCPDHNKPVCPPSKPSGTGKPYYPVTRLPQTGQLSWPIPVMAISGMVFFGLGWWLCFGKRKDPHEK